MHSISRCSDSLSARGAGYASREYAESLAEFGTLHELPRCRGWLLANETPHPNLYDAASCYPLFSCADWSALGSDLESLADRFVSVRLVTDPFASVGYANLQELFPEVCYEYKQHFVTDLTAPLESFIASHHRRNARKALNALTIRETTGDAVMLADWRRLYGNLVTRHGINGIAGFSPLAFERQTMVPGFKAFSALDGTISCGMTLWYVQGDVAYYHLGAYSDRGYNLGASFALFWFAFNSFAELGIRWAALGAGAGLQSAESGLTRFKSGWSTHTRPVYFCGRILQAAAYAKLAAGTGTSTSFFPAYRAA